MRSLPLSSSSTLLSKRMVSWSGAACCTTMSSISSSCSRWMQRADENAAAIACGEIHLILGPMFAGKTTALLNRVQCETDAGRNVVLVKSNKDTRYGLASVVSHCGRQMPCSSLARLSELKLDDGYAQAQVIGIDEAQFFDDLLAFCQCAADMDGKTLIVAGLDGDFLRRRFGSALDLIPLADSVTKLSSRCHVCGRAAAFTLRKTDDKHTEVIGGADVYMPVCRQHYVTLSSASSS